MKELSLQNLRLDFEKYKLNQKSRQCNDEMERSRKLKLTSQSNPSTPIPPTTTLMVKDNNNNKRISTTDVMVIQDDKDIEIEKPVNNNNHKLLLSQLQTINIQSTVPIQPQTPQIIFQQPDISSQTSNLQENTKMLETLKTYYESNITIIKDGYEKRINQLNDLLSCLQVNKTNENDNQTINTLKNALEVKSNVFIIIIEIFIGIE